MLVGTHQRTAAADYLVIDISNTCLDRVYNLKCLGVLQDHTLSMPEGPCSRVYWQ